MVASTTAAEAPGYCVDTETWGGTMSGYWATGNANSASTPAIVVTMAMTTASRGRSTKMADSTGSGPTESYGRRRCRHPHARTYALQPFDDNLFTPRQPFHNDIGSDL